MTRVWSEQQVLQGLVLVHPSSLDSYRWTMGRELATDLDENMHAAATENQGPAWVLYDSEMAGEIAESFRSELEAERPDVVWVEHSDAIRRDWRRLERELPRVLRAAGVSKVVLGGIWWEPKTRGGCVGAVLEILEKERIPVEVSAWASGSEDDSWDEGEHWDT